MNTYEILHYFGLKLWVWEEIMGNSPQEAVYAFRQFKDSTIIALRDADSKELVEDWE